jgi:hypothetical protein
MPKLVGCSVAAPQSYPGIHSTSSSVYEYWERKSNLEREPSHWFSNTLIFK